MSDNGAAAWANSGYKMGQVQCAPGETEDTNMSGMLAEYGTTGSAATPTWSPAPFNPEDPVTISAAPDVPLSAKNSGKSGSTR